MESRETITRRNLPHWFRPGAAHFVTYRIHGTIPADVVRRLRSEREVALRQLRPGDRQAFAMREQAHKSFFAQYDRYLDNNRQIDWLASPAIATIIRDNLRWLQFDGQFRCLRSSV